MSAGRTLPEKVAPGDETWVQLAPLGRHPLWNGEKKKYIDQVLDREAAWGLCMEFSGDILVDADHSSENGGSTEALAWITELSDRDDGLWALFRWTDKGAEAVSARRYRFVSPAWTLSDDGRPGRLVSCALTNRPNIRSKPILNSAAGGSGEPTTQPEKEHPAMEELKTMLGLPADADEAAVAAAVKALKDKVAEQEEAALNSAAEAFADAHKDKVADKAVLVNAYKKDPKVAKSLVENMKAPATAPAALPDFSKGRPPAALNSKPAAAGKPATPEDAYRAYVAMEEGPAKDAYLAANAQAISDGHEAVVLNSRK